MSRVTTAEVQAWLSGDRHVVTEDDLNDQLELSVLGQLESVYDTSTWTNASTTPELVRSIFAMLNAALILRRVYADQVDVPQYAAKLEGMSAGALAHLLDGDYVVAGITDAEATAVQVANTAGMFPTDTDRLEEGGDHVIRFTMGVVF